MLIYLLPFGIAAYLAVMWQYTAFRLDRLLYGPALFALGLMGGLRYETGRDWENYRALFDYINIRQGPIEAYTSSVSNLPYEPGYYVLNWVVKSLGADYWVVFLIASLFCAYAVYRLTRHFDTNKFYVLAIYLSYSFVLLHFAQVRQSIGIGFFLLGVEHYLRKGKLLPALLIAFVAPLFQYSSIIYIVLFVVVARWPKRAAGKVAGALAVLAFGILPFAFDPFSLVAMATPGLALGKVSRLEENPTPIGPGSILYALYLALLAAYFLRYRQRVGNDSARFVVRFAIVSLGFTAFMVFIFPNSLAMYSRSYLVASIFQGYAASLIFYWDRRRAIHTMVFVLTIVVALGYYAHMITLFAADYIPYKWVL